MNSPFDEAYEQLNEAGKSDFRKGIKRFITRLLTGDVGRVEDSTIQKAGQGLIQDLINKEAILESATMREMRQRVEGVGTGRLSGNPICVYHDFLVGEEMILMQVQEAVWITSISVLIPSAVPRKVTFAAVPSNEVLIPRTQLESTAGTTPTAYTNYLFFTTDNFYGEKWSGEWYVPAGYKIVFRNDYSGAALHNFILSIKDA